MLKGEPSDITLDIRTMRKDVLSAIATGARNGVANAGNFRGAGVTRGGGRRRLGREGSRRSAAIFPRLHVAGLSVSPPSVGRMDRRGLLAGAAALGGAALLPRAAAAQSEPRRGGVLRWANPPNPGSLDPVTGELPPSSHFCTSCSTRFSISIR